ncbi:MAG: phosphoribosyl-ATP diphosphatase [Kiloniellaceae bacterium]
MTDALQRLYAAVTLERGENPKTSRTSKLFADGRIKIAKKLVEEASEVSLEYVTNNRDEVVHESVDMLYNWIVLLSEMGIRPAEVWEEMERREAEYGIAGKLPKSENGDGQQGKKVAGSGS